MSNINFPDAFDLTGISVGVSDNSHIDHKHFKNFKKTELKDDVEHISTCSKYDEKSTLEEGQNCAPFCCCESEKDECDDGAPFCCCESDKECESEAPFCCCESEEECEDGAPFCCCEEKCECDLLKKKPVPENKKYRYTVDVKGNDFYINGKKTPTIRIRKEKNYIFRLRYDKIKHEFIIYKKGKRSDPVDISDVLKGSSLSGEYEYGSKKSSVVGGNVVVE